MLGRERDDGDVGSELRELSRELVVVKRLANQGAAFYQGWARVLGGAASGYMPTGDAEPLRAPGSISIRG
jgi:hypothetical protein